MHELSVCQALLDQVTEIASQYRGARVSAITVRMGPLSGVEAHLLKQAFSLARANSVAAGANLLVEQEPVRARCTACDEEFETEPNRLRCPDCKSGSIHLVSGDALILASVAIERPEPAVEARDNGALYV